MLPPKNPYKGIKEFPDEKDLVKQEEFSNKLTSEAIGLLCTYDNDQYDVRVDMKVSIFRKDGNKENE